MGLDPRRCWGKQGKPSACCWAKTGTHLSHSHLLHRSALMWTGLFWGSRACSASCAPGQLGPQCGAFWGARDRLCCRKLSGCNSCGRVCITMANWEAPERVRKCDCGGDQTHRQASEVTQRLGARRDLCNPLSQPLNLLRLQETPFSPSVSSLCFQCLLCFKKQP